MNQRTATEADAEIGRKIRLRRVELKISQQELGEKLGISFQQVQKYEKGVNRVHAARLERIADILDIPTSFFYASGDASHTAEMNSLLFTDSSFAMRLLRAYVAIPDQAIRRQMVLLMETVAASKQEHA